MRNYSDNENREMEDTIKNVVQDEMSNLEKDPAPGSWEAVASRLEENKEKEAKTIPGRGRRWWRMASAAAVFLLLLAGGVYFSYYYGMMDYIAEEDAFDKEEPEITVQDREHRDREEWDYSTKDAETEDLPVPDKGPQLCDEDEEEHADEKDFSRDDIGVATRDEDSPEEEEKDLKEEPHPSEEGEKRELTDEDKAEDEEVPEEIPLEDYLKEEYLDKRVYAFADEVELFMEKEEPDEQDSDMAAMYDLEVRTVEDKKYGKEVLFHLKGEYYYLDTLQVSEPGRLYLLYSTWEEELEEEVIVYVKTFSSAGETGMLEAMEEDWAEKEDIKRISFSVEEEDKFYRDNAGRPLMLWEEEGKPRALWGISENIEKSDLQKLQSFVTSVE